MSRLPTFSLSSKRIDFFALLNLSAHLADLFIVSQCRTDLHSNQMFDLVVTIPHTTLKVISLAALTFSLLPQAAFMLNKCQT